MYVDSEMVNYIYFSCFTSFILHYGKQEPITVVFFPFIRILGDDFLFPWRNSPQTKKSSTTLWNLWVAEVSSLKATPRAEKKASVSQEMGQAPQDHKLGKPVTSVVNTTDPEQTGGTLYLLASTTTSKGSLFIYGLKNAFQMAHECLWGVVQREMPKCE